MKKADLAQRSLAFAREVQDLLDRTLPGKRSVISVEYGDRFIVRADGTSAKSRQIPLLVNSQHLAGLNLSLYQRLDRTNHFLKTYKSDFAVYSTLDGNPLLRLEYDAQIHTAPVSHWQVHAERGAFANLLSHAHSLGRVKEPHRLSSLHLPTGGERFRPAIEDLLEFLIRDCGIDSVAGWEQAIQEGREKWRRRQFYAAVRDLQEEAAKVLREHSWTVEPPDHGPDPEWIAPYRRW